MGMEFFIGILVVSIKDFLLGINEKDMDRCFGLMGMCIGGNGNKEYNMGKVNYL
jgi:hypothetical protein